MQYHIAAVCHGKEPKVRQGLGIIQCVCVCVCVLCVCVLCVCVGAKAPFIKRTCERGLGNQLTQAFAVPPVIIVGFFK